jgi:hypothetical protein
VKAQPCACGEVHDAALAERLFGPEPLGHVPGLPRIVIPTPPTWRELRTLRILADCFTSARKARQ